MEYTWDFGSVWEYREALWVGLINTLRIFVICLVAGLSLGLAMGLARYSVRRWLRWPDATPASARPSTRPPGPIH